MNEETRAVLSYMQDKLDSQEICLQAIMTVFRLWQNEPSCTPSMREQARAATETTLDAYLHSGVTDRAISLARERLSGLVVPISS